MASRSTRGLNTINNEVINNDKRLPKTQDTQHSLLSRNLSTSLPHNKTTMLTGRSTVANDGRSTGLNYQIESAPRFLENEAPISNQTNYWQTEVPRDIGAELHARRYNNRAMSLQDPSSLYKCQSFFIKVQN